MGVKLERKVQFSRCNSNNLSNVPKQDGQIIFVKDTQDAYLDNGEERSKITDIIFLNTLEELNSVANPLMNKLYYVAEDNALHKFSGEAWSPIKATAQETSFDNTETTLEATTVQQAITEVDNAVATVDAKVGDIGAVLDKINGSTESGV